MRLGKRERIAKRQGLALARAKAIRSAQVTGSPIPTSMSSLNIVSTSNPGASLFRAGAKDKPTYSIPAVPRVSSQAKGSGKKRWAMS